MKISPKINALRTLYIANTWGNTSLQDEYIMCINYHMYIKELTSLIV